MSSLVSTLLFITIVSFNNFSNAYQISLPVPISVTPDIRIGPLSVHPRVTPSTMRQTSNLLKSPLFAETTNSELSSDDDKEKEGAMKRFLKMLKPKSASGNMTTKEMLAKMGLSTLLSYGFVSNMSICVTVSLAWFGFTKKTGLSPLAPGQWKGFLAVYAGFYVFNNIIRPFRIGISVGVAKYFDDAISTVQEKLKVSKGLAIGIIVFFVNILGTCSLMSLGIFLASLCSGVPIFPPKV